MTYQEQLTQPEWEAKRQKILKRDGYKCTICNRERTVFRGLIKSFGICSIQEMINKGYELLSKNVNEHNHDSLKFRKDGRNYEADYVGDSSHPFELDKLRFSLIFQKVPSPLGGFATSTYLVSYYPKDIEEQGLVDLNIHHKFYTLGKKAWEYEDSALVSLCIKCHKETHEQNTIYTLDSEGQILYINEVCHKCCGSGYLEEYSYYQGGICFQCHGEGVIMHNGQTIGLD